ncbi:MAG: hypothetical protein PHQ12_02710 [Chthoniobacteraceae bacterium]|nr:hypothetical protein [Chthoniobacteraceae bacterium]
MDFRYLTQKERAAGIIFLALFALFNVATAAFSPIPWLDEVSYTDPAATWFFGGGFQSSLWEEAGKGFWVGNVPLHQFLLCLWMKVFGFGIGTVRSASIVYYILAVGILWSALRRTGFLHAAATRFLFVLIALGATGCVAVFRNGRYDALGVLLVSVAVWAVCRRDASLKSDLLLFAAAALLPWAGLQLLPFFGIATLCYLAILKRSGIRGFLAGNIGMSCGILSLLAFYYLMGYLPAFVKAIRRQGWSSPLDILVAGPLNPTSMAVIVLGLALLWASRNWEFPAALSFKRRAASALVVFGVAVPFVMYAVGKYTIYYSWMSILPCAAGLLFFWEQCANPRLRLAILFVAALSVLPGYPRRVLGIAGGDTLQNEKKIETFVNSHLSRDDVPLMGMSTEFAAYYPVKMRARNILFDSSPAVDPAMARTVTAAVLSGPGREAELGRRLGGS